MNILNIPSYRLRGIYKNFLSFFSIFSTQTIIQILYPPAMIFAWGIENFGIWILLTSIPSILTILNINFSSASRSEMSIFYEKKKLTHVNKIFQNTLCLILLSSLLFFLIWVTIFSLDKIDFKTLENIDVENFKIIFLFLVLSSHCLIIDQIFYCGITYKGDTSKYNYNILIYDILIKIIIPFLGLFTNNLIYASLILFILSICKTFCLFILFKYQNKNNFNLKTNLFDTKLCIKLFKLSFSYQLDNISHIIRNNGLIILVGSFFSPIIVGLISTSRTLFYFLPIRFLDVINSTLFFEFSKMYGRRDLSLSKVFFKYHILANIFMMIVFSILSVIFGKFIYDFWTNNKYDLSTSLMIIIIADAVVFNLFNSLEIFIKSINKFLYSASLKAFLSILTIFLSHALFAFGYTLHSYFILNIISSFIILIFILFITYRIFNKYYK